jgi:hypothetical protein
MRLHTTLAAVLAAVVACGGGDQSGSAADSSARNLTLAPADSMAMLRDVPEAGAPPAPAPPKPAPARPAAPTTYSLPSGTGFDMTVNDSITSRTAKVGDAVTATVVEDLRNAAGRIVVPAGSVAHGVITEVKPAANTRAVGTLTIAFSTISVRGRDYPVGLAVDSLETTHKARGIEGADAARVGAGAAAGAIAGRILGKNAKGTVIGGVVGAGAGAIVSARVKDMDIVLAQGARIIVRLVEKLTVRAT